MESSRGYTEIPGVYTSSPRAFVGARRLCRNYQTCIGATVLTLLIISLVGLASVLIGQSIATNNAEPQPMSATNRTLVTLMALPFPRRDRDWYNSRWDENPVIPDAKDYPSSTPEPPTTTQDSRSDPEERDGGDEDVDEEEMMMNEDLNWARGDDRSLFPRDDGFNWARMPEPVPNVTDRDLSESLAFGSRDEQWRDELERRMEARNMSLQPGTPSHYHQHSFRKTSPIVRGMAKQGYLMERATQEIGRRMKLSREQSTMDSRRMADLGASPYCDSENQRSHPTRCDEKALYRSADGSCNNLKNPLWGASFTAFRRGLPAIYDDGVSIPRRSVAKSELPSARQVSTGVHTGHHAESKSYTHLAMTWGQFVDHDITATAQTKGPAGETIKCCFEGALNNDTIIHPECLAIQIPKNDSFYSSFNKTCMEFTRSAPAPRCELGPRDQLNQLTAYLDGSIIYGSTSEEMDNLRQHTDGLLKTQVTDDGRELLPPSNDSNDGCNLKTQMGWHRYCFQSGDSRVNEQIMLTVMHTIWAREHNSMALTLKDLNPEWNDERLFQEARRIIVAQIQHITYHEYIPSVLGPTLTKAKRLSPLEGSKHLLLSYDPSINAGISNEFAAAAFRFGHSMIQGLVQKIDQEGKNVAFQQLKKTLFNPFPLYDIGVMGDYARGSIAQMSCAVDTYFSAQVTHRLFQARGAKYGLDLVAINIQRGRDHGIPPYNRWRMMCGFPPALNFTDLRQDMDRGALDALSKVYKSVDDIDLYSGGLAELPMKDALVGPTFACILTDQFVRLKRGDRFWYENGDSPAKFTPNQLVEIRKASLARILCNNIESLSPLRLFPQIV
ncbi:salivary peroxidase/catechol oxidase-like isoform X2 [Oratosquilla oratoria]|uniref:salivary peroxidase/catechol oxidase-like isoform X2 n=1 Tax=Oratosquilla oratoria TaxID=337810 RepID=UPI003F76F1F9